MDQNRPKRSSRALAGLIVGALGAGALGYGAALRSLTPPPVDEPRSLAFLNRVAATINPLFPRQVDAATEITRVSALEGVFVYHYRFVKVSASELDKDVLARLQPTVTQASCSNEATLNAFIKRDITLRYHYSDKVGRPLASFDVTRADCGV